MFALFKSHPGFSPRSIVCTLWRRKWQILAVTLMGSAAGVVAVYRLQSVFSANAVILVESQAIPEAYIAATVQTPLEARLDMLKQQVLSRDLLWSLIEGLNLYPRERQRLTKEEVLQLLRDDIKINLVRGWSARGPGAFEVVYEAPKPEIAAKVANRVGLFFINENLRQRTGEAVATSDFLNQQLAESEARLREQENVLKVFKLSHNGELPQQEGALLASMGQSKAELLGTQDALGRAQQNRLILESSAAYAIATMREREERQRVQSADSAAVAIESPAPDRPAVPTDLERARTELAALRVRYFDSHPDVVRALREVERLERAEKQRAAVAPAQDRTATTAAPRRPAEPGARLAPADAAAESSEATRLQEVQAQLALQSREIQNLERRRQSVLEEIAETQRRLRNIPACEQQLAAITRDYETCKTNYATLLNKKLAADVAANMERWQKSQRFVMLDRARVPQKPVRPRRILLSISGALLSLIVSAALAFMLELRSNVLLGEWELPAGTPVLGRVPQLRVESR